VRTWLSIIFWICAIVIAVLLDRTVATWARESGIEAFLRAESHRWLRVLLKTPGEYWFTVIVVILAWWKHPLHWKAAAFLALATLVSGANGIIKWMVGRVRPFKWDETGRLAPLDFHPFRGGLSGLFDSKNLCFPSGHAALAFATAAGAAILWPRARWIFYVVACVVAAERFGENAHWLSDCVAAAALGVGGVYLIRWLFGRRLLVGDLSTSELWTVGASGTINEKR
jgi:membrane-associated phospholipid phosphatase